MAVLLLGEQGQPWQQLALSIDAEFTSAKCEKLLKQRTEAFDGSAHLVLLR